MINNYQIFLIQDDQVYAELDCEDLDIKSTFSITDIADVSTKKDNFSENIIFSGTKNNNQIFGNPFNASRLVEKSNLSILRSNFSGNRKVECVVFENNIQILKGYLKLIKTTKINGEYEYDCIISGNIFNFYSLLSNSLLSDLSFSEFTHTYNIANIAGSWSRTTGTGFVYPLINYGDKSSPNAGDVNKIHINNFRPSIYLNQYLKSIFNQDKLKGFSYEIKGSDDFKTEINGLIIPDNSDSFNQVSEGETLLYLWNTENIGTGNARITPGSHLYRSINFEIEIDVKGFVAANQFNFFGQTNNLYSWRRDVNGDFNIYAEIYINNQNASSIKTSLRFMERDFSVVDNINDFSVVEELIIGNVAGNSSLTKIVNFVIPQRAFSEQKQFTLMFYAEAPDVSFTDDKFSYTISNVLLQSPSVQTNKVTYSVLKGDSISPQAVSGIKQKDFIKSFCLLYNLYTYSSLENPKHIIFESYKDYYSKAKVNSISQNAIDWSYKVDNGSDLVVSSFTDTAKKYSFTYKGDQDYFNTLYTSKYSEIYGQNTENDSTGNGINDEKKIELTFSPTPLVNYNNTNRINPEIYNLNSDNTRSTIKSNIRILHFNGVKECTPYQIGTIEITGTTYNFYPIVEVPFSGTFSIYPQVGHIRFATGTTNYNYISDLNFGKAKEYYFLAKPEIETLPNQYSRFYQDQILELSDLNTTLFDCEVLLNPVDISNLDLKTPVFINSEDGNSYYKVLKVDYRNQFETSSVQLQKIII